MQITFDTPPRMISGRDDADPRRGELGVCFPHWRWPSPPDPRSRRRAPRCREAVARVETSPGAGGAPQMAGDDDRRAHRGCYRPAHECALAAGPECIVVVVHRAARPVRTTVATMFSPSSVNRPCRASLFVKPELVGKRPGWPRHQAPSGRGPHCAHRGSAPTLPPRRRTPPSAKRHARPMSPPAAALPVTRGAP